MNVTDYTKPESTMKGLVLPSRFANYLLDLIKLWLSDPRNIPVDELKGLKYIDGDTISALNSSDVYVDIAWPEDQRISGKTPAILIAYGNSTSKKTGIAIPICANGNFPGQGNLLTIDYDINIIVRAASYTGVQVLSEMVFDYLRIFQRKIQTDANLSSFTVVQLTNPDMSQSPGDVKDVFRASIVCKVSGTYVSCIDTTGPVFRGVTVKDT